MKPAGFNQTSRYLVVILFVLCVFQLFPQIEEVMVQPLRESRDRYEELKQIDDAMNEVSRVNMIVCACVCFKLALAIHIFLSAFFFFSIGAEKEK